MGPFGVLMAVAGTAYGVAGVVGVVRMVRGMPGVAPWVRRLLGAGVAVQTLALVWRMVVLDLPPATGGLDGLGLLGLMAVVGFLFMSRRYPLAAMGALVAPLACLCVAASVLLTASTQEVPQVLRTGYFWVHVSLAFTGNALLAVAATAGVAYVLQERNLRLKRMGPSVKALPNLTVADQVAWRAATVGFLFMTLGIASGMAFSKYAWHAWWSWDPRQTWSLMTWFCYAGLLHIRLISGWRGRRWAWLTVGAFGLVVGASVVLDVFKLGRHSGDFQWHPPAQTGVL